MRLFAASIGTETNTFAPIPTALESFHEAFYAPPRIAIKAFTFFSSGCSYNGSPTRCTEEAQHMFP
jgi:microcystin degradation protein MlrC